jgi:AraC family transcriptional regulator of adaptative response/methylated-DNA-[protein]-cysteine methyltransferase
LKYRAPMKGKIKREKASREVFEIEVHTFRTPLGGVAVGAINGGLCYLGLGLSRSGLVADLKARFSVERVAFVAAPKSRVLRQARKDVAAYLAGNGFKLSAPFDLLGTPFQLRVWSALCSLQFGEVISYSELAKRVGAPKAVRAAASACGANPIALFVPCHRVVPMSGLTAKGASRDLGGYRWGVQRKKKLLMLERYRIGSNR